MSRTSSLRLACLVLLLLVLPALARAQTPPPPGLPVPDGLIAADADQRQFPPLLHPPAPVSPPAPAAPSDAPELAAPAATQAFWQNWSRVAYWGFDGNDYELYTIPPGTGHSLKLTDTPTSEAQPAISPDLRRLAFVGNNDGDYDLYLMDYTLDGPAGYVNRLLNTPGHEYWPVWSPDGTRLAFYSFNDGQAEIYTIRADGSQLTRLTNTPAFDGYPTWSPDGTRLAFSSTRSGGYRIHVMNADGSNVRQLSSQSGSLYPTWSPDGARIAYSADPNGDGWLDFMLMRADGGEQQIFHYAQPLHDYQLRSWSPDSTAVALTEIEYIMFQGEYYIKEAITAIHTLDIYHPTPIAPSYTFDPAWVKIDWLPPETRVAPLPAESPYLFTVHWSGRDHGPAEFYNYDIQVRAGNGPWTDWQPETGFGSEEFIGMGGVSYAFRSRGRDFAGNVEPWPATPDAVTRVESNPPRSTMTALPSWTRAGQRITLHWRGYDLGNSGVHSFQAQYRRNDGAWTDVPQPHDTQATLDLASLGFVSGDRLGVRVRATDNARNVEPWPADPGDTTTTLFSRSLSGRVSDNTGTPIVGATADLSPSPLAPVSSGPDGTYSAYYTAAATALTVRFGKTGYGALPAAAVPLAEDAGYLAVLPPADDVVDNGGFEAGGWGAWQVGGSNPPTQGAGHTGAGAAFGQPAAPFSDRHRLSDTPNLTEDAATLTLDGAGNAFVLWRALPPDVPPWEGAHPLFSAARRPDGQWLPTSQIMDSVTTYDVAVDGTGRLHVAVWVMPDRVYLLHQSGLGWSAAEAVPYSAGASYPDLVARPDGRLDLFFMTPQGHLLHLPRAANGTWAAPNDLGEMYMNAGGAVMDANGGLHALSLSYNHIVHRYLPAGGQWSAVETLATFEGHTDHLVAADPLGGIHLVWLDAGNNAGRLAYRGWRDGQWSAPEAPLPPLGSSSYLMGWGVGPDGQPQMLIGSGQQLMYLRRGATGWGEPEIRTLSAHNASATMILDASGAPHVAYMDDDANSIYNVFYTMRNPTGEWTPGTNLSQSDYWSHNGLLATDPLGNVHAIWQFSTEKGDGTSRPSDIGYAGPLPGTATGDARLSQTVAVPANMAHPTLSFLYAAVGALKVSVGDAPAVTLPASPAGMSHRWLPLPNAAGRNVTITFELTQQAGLPPMWATLDEVTLGAGHADVWVTAESSRGQPGGRAAHTLRVGNRGGVAAAGVTLTYTLPPELTFVSASRPPTSTAPLRWEIGALPARGAPLVIEVTTAVRPDAPGRTVSSTATLTAAAELELANNTATAQTPLGSLIYLPGMMRSD